MIKTNLSTSIAIMGEEHKMETKKEIKKAHVNQAKRLMRLG